MYRLWTVYRAWGSQTWERNNKERTGAAANGPTAVPVYEQFMYSSWTIYERPPRFQSSICSPLFLSGLWPETNHNSGLILPRTLVRIRPESGCAKTASVIDKPLVLNKTIVPGGRRHESTSGPGPNYEQFMNSSCTNHERKLNWLTIPSDWKTFSFE